MQTGHNQNILHIFRQHQNSLAAGISVKDGWPGKCKMTVIGVEEGGVRVDGKKEEN